MSLPKLSSAQEKLLRQIVASNGGGVSLNGVHYRTWEILYELDLIQGKSGHQSVAVHTREGLDWVRESDLLAENQKIEEAHP